MTRVATVQKGQPSPDGPDDLASLLGAASRGEESAWRELVARYSKRLFALARSRCRSVELAEEITTVGTKLNRMITKK